MANIKNINPELQYYIDWLRIILIISVFLFHIGMVFNTWSRHIRNYKQYGGIALFISPFLDSFKCIRIRKILLKSEKLLYRPLGLNTIIIPLRFSHMSLLEESWY